MLRTGLALALALVAAPARAGTTTPLPHISRLAYAAPPGCPGEQVLRDLIAGQTSTNVLSPQAPARLAVTVTRRAQQYEATAELRDQAGSELWTRPFAPTSSCSGLVEDVAVYVSAKLERRAQDQPPASRTAPADADTTQPPHPHDRDSMPTDPLILLFGLGSTLGFGVAPRVAVGLTADVGVHWTVDAGPLDGFSLSVGMRWDPPASRHLPGYAPIAPDAQVTTSRLLVTGAPCVHLWKLFGCGLIELGNMHESADNIPVTAEGNVLLFGVGGRLGIEVPFAAHVGFRGFGEALGARKYDTIRIDGVPVYISPVPHASVGAGLYVFF